MRLCPSFSMAKMPGNITPGRAANSCAASMTSCRVSRESRRLRFPRRSLGTTTSARSLLWSLAPGSMPTSTCGLARPRITAPGIIFINARNFYAEAAGRATEAQRKLALEELFIAEGSDWNWWYGPEHHSANDREFDELYRKHLSNVYQALGAIAARLSCAADQRRGGQARVHASDSYIHPRITGDMVRYFEWMGAAVHTADHRAGAMHGKQFLVDCVHTGIDEDFVYGRLDFVGKPPEVDFDLVVNLESLGGGRAASTARVAIGCAREAGKSRLMAGEFSG